MSRALWMAIGSSIVPLGVAGIACSTSDATSNASTASGDASLPPADDASPTDVAVAEDLDAAMDADAAPLVCPPVDAPDSGTFPCGETQCDRATQYCGVNYSGHCIGIGTYRYECVDKDAGFFPTSCLACQSCGCIQPIISTRDVPRGENPVVWHAETWHCSHENGGISIGHYYVNCNSCYGAPPARREVPACPERHRVAGLAA